MLPPDLLHVGSGRDVRAIAEAVLTFDDALVREVERLGLLAG